MDSIVGGSCLGGRPVFEGQGKEDHIRGDSPPAAILVQLTLDTLWSALQRVSQASSPFQAFLPVCPPLLSAPSPSSFALPGPTLELAKLLWGVNDWLFLSLPAAQQDVSPRSSRAKLPGSEGQR